VVLATGNTVRAQDVAVIVKVKGNVTYQSPESDSWEPAKQGLTLSLGCSVRTGSDGLAMVKFVADGSMMRLKPETNLTLSGKDDKRGIMLGMGAALFEITPAKQGKSKGFTVTTPTSVAAVKGTRFWVLVDGDSASAVVCLEGLVGVTHRESGKSRDVKAGMTAVSRPDEFTVRETRSGDLPAGERTRRLELRFEGSDGSTRTLEIESTNAR